MREIRHFMAEAPHAIGHDQRLEKAHERMQQLGIRHLPVLDGGALVGVVSERDVALIGALSPEAAATITVEEAMSEEPFAVAPADSIIDVCKRMAEQRFDCAVVMDHNKVVGIFTTTDALHMLAAALGHDGVLGQLAEARSAAAAKK